MNFDLVIHGGTLVTASEIFISDIGIVDGKIAVLGRGLRGKQMIDASGKLVLPGAVDPHVHLEMPQGTAVSSDNFETGTIAAAYGGTTTIIDFVEPEGEQKLVEALRLRQGQANGRAVIDFGLHMTIAKVNADTLTQIPEAFNAGCFSFKTYTIYDGFYLDDNEMLEALSAVRAVNGLLIVHAENRHIVDRLQKQFLAADKTGPRYHPRSRPSIVEGTAINRVLALAEIAGCPIYVVHVSTQAGAKAVQAAQERGQIAYGETCPQYLLLTDAEYERPGREGAKYICSPPLRPKGNPQALWDSLAELHLNSVGTDHCPFFYQGTKDLDYNDFTQIPNGLPGIESRLALLYSYGVRQNRISLNRWVEVCCTAPAKIFALYPRKGSLMPGADADIVIFDHEREVTITADMLHENVDYTPYEGFSLRGYPQITLVRGQIMVQDGEFVGPQGWGKFLSRPYAGQS
jgi:dihydropyrimidinase